MTSLPSPYIDDIFWIAVIITPIIVAVKLLLKNRKAFLNLMGCVCSAAAIIVPIMTRSLVAVRQRQLYTTN